MAERPKTTASQVVGTTTMEGYMFGKQAESSGQNAAKEIGVYFPRKKYF